MSFGFGIFFKLLMAKLWFEKKLLVITVALNLILLALMIQFIPFFTRFTSKLSLI
jgi:hypothetical protein